MKYSILTAVTLCVFATMVLSACENTWHGAGRDVEEVGDSMQSH